MDLKEFKEFLESNKKSSEVQEILKGEFSNFISSDEGLKTLQPLLDSHGSKVVEAYKSKGMQKELEKVREEVRLELNPPKNPLEQKVAELEAKYMKAENEKALLSVREKALKQLKHKELESLLNVSTDEEATLERVKSINENVDKMIDAAVESRFKAGERIPGGSNKSIGEGYFTQEQVSKMSSKEIKSNYDKIQESQKNW